MTNTILTAIGILGLVASIPSGDGRTPALAPIKVFILAGQSNMEGKAKNELLDLQARAPETARLFAHLREGDEWVVRKDVFIRYGDRRGGLTIGYGSPGRTGVELELGTALGDRYGEPVLLIKTAWGGHALSKQFRSPSAGLPDSLDEEVARAREQVAKKNEKNGTSEPLPTRDDIVTAYGSSYRRMLAEIAETQRNYREWFPTLAARKLELAGFVWFQGWNDQYGAEAEYESNMAHFIRDVRRDLDAPKLPFVIGVMGQNGPKPAQGAMLTIQRAQLAMETKSGFAGNVKAVRTDVLVDAAAETLYPEWKERTDEWNRVGSDHPYHYYGSAIWFSRMGRAFADAFESLKGR